MLDVIRTRPRATRARGSAAVPLRATHRGAERPRHRPALWFVAALAIGASGCVYDADERCGPNRVYQPDKGLCVCAPNLIEKGDACITPPAKAPEGLGVTCDSASKPCTDATFSVCHVAAGATEGYCTRGGCTAIGDCEGGYACALDATPPYCKRPPTGEGMECAAEDDCKDFEASFCTIGNPAGATCVVANCVSDADCSPARKCIDLSGIVPGLPKQCLPAQ